ncbi:MAG: PLP-dependent aminotransferase family protein [Desulfurococcaceae archaeon]
MARPDYYKFFSSRLNFIEPSPIREMVSKIAKKSREARVISFAAGDPDPDVIPRKMYAEISKEAFETEKRSVIYSPTEGIPELREETAKFMSNVEGVNTSPDNILITLGGSQALDLIGRMLFDPGDIVIVENPSYVNTILTWRQYGVRILGIPMDEDGMKVHVLEETLKELRSEGKIAKLVYTIPTGQNPTGITMAMDRRKYLLELASTYDLLVVEDGAYNYLVYEPLELRSIKSMDREERVIFVGTYSKIFGTGLRVGWLLLPSGMVEKFKAAKGPTDMCAPVPSQFIVYGLLKKGLFEQIRNHAIKAYKEKRDLMIKALEDHMPGLKHTTPIAGMFVFLWLPEHVNGWRFAEEALEKYAVATIPGAPFYTDGSGKSSLRLNFSLAPKDMIEEGVRRLGALLRELV